MGSYRQEYWSGLPFPSPGDHLDPGIKPTSLMSPELAGRFFRTSSTWEDPVLIKHQCNNELSTYYIKKKKNLWQTGSERAPGIVNGNPLQYFSLKNFMGRGVWWATVHGIAKRQTH